MIPDEEIQELMESHDLDEDTAEQVREAMDDTALMKTMPLSWLRKVFEYLNWPVLAISTIDPLTSIALYAILNCYTKEL